MIGFLDYASHVLVLIFVVSGMAAMGLSLRLQHIFAPLRQPRLLLATLAANFLLVPIMAYALTRLAPLDPAYETGLLLLGAAAGAPFLPKLIEFARGDVALSVGIMLVQTVGTILFLPFALPWFIPGLDADAWSIARPLLFMMLLPLAIGLIAQRLAPNLARLAFKPLSTLANLTLLLATLLLFCLNISSFLHTFGTGAALLATVFVLFAMLIGWFAGQVYPGTTSVQTLGTGQRNIAAALVVATSKQMDNNVVVMLLLTTFVGLALLLAVAQIFRRGGFKP